MAMLSAVFGPAFVPVPVAGAEFAIAHLLFPFLRIAVSETASHLPPGMDSSAARRWMELPRSHSPWLHEEVASRMAERLRWFKSLPSSWLDWEPMLGGMEGHGVVQERLGNVPSRIFSFREAVALKALGVKPAVRWNPFRRQGTVSIAQAQERFDMVWANMQLHAHPDPQRLLGEWHSRLDEGGFLMFSCFGPDTLRELRQVHQENGWPEPTTPFTDMHDWGDMLVHGGFAEPVMDMERIELSWSSAEALLAELRGLGRNLSTARHPTLRGRRWRDAWLNAVTQGLPRDSEGRLKLSFEVIYGHAYRVTRTSLKSDNSVIALDDMRQMLRGSGKPPR